MRKTTAGYPGLWDFSGWIATPPPAPYGPAVRSVLAEIATWDAERAAKVSTAFMQAARQRPNDMVGAVARIGNAARRLSISRHYISGTGTPVSLQPWATAIRLSVGEGPAWVLTAVAVRDRQAVSDGDWQQITGWWADCGLPLPEPISDAEREHLAQWMVERAAELGRWQS